MYLGSHIVRTNRVRQDADSGDHTRSGIQRWELLRPARWRRPHRGLGLARELAHITYRCPTEFDQRFGRTPQEGEDPLAGGRYAVSSYLDYHAYKLALRFDANSYIAISQSMITHDIGRGRGGTDAVTRTLEMPALVVAVDTDRLFYPRDVEELADLLPGSGPAVAWSQNISTTDF